jgi:hypothetical protein
VCYCNCAILMCESCDGYYVHRDTNAVSFLSKGIAGGECSSFVFYNCSLGWQNLCSVQVRYHSLRQISRVVWNDAKMRLMI